MIYIGNRRELFIDDYLVDMERRDAEQRMHHHICREMVMTNDAPWEGDGWVYYTVFEDAGIYRMYYLSMPMINAERTRHDPPYHHINYAYSADDVYWVKPKLGLWEFNGSCDNNIVMVTDTMDAFHVLLDNNPSVPSDQWYKTVYLYLSTGWQARLWSLPCCTLWH